MSDDLLDYPRLLQDALRGLVRRALEVVAAGGFPGAHHFYLSFRTDHPDVEVPADLRARYPEEMTVVLQHQFWDLEVDDRGFGVSLAFGGAPRRLRVPWGALVGFSDPAVSFGLRFEPVAPPEEPPPMPAEGGNVVSMDRFRKR